MNQIISRQQDPLHYSTLTQALMTRWYRAS
jgi:hypothetical protein